MTQNNLNTVKASFFFCYFSAFVLFRRENENIKVTYTTLKNINYQMQATKIKKKKKKHSKYEEVKKVNQKCFVKGRKHTA